MFFSCKSAYSAITSLYGHDELFLNSFENINRNHLCGVESLGSNGGGHHVDHLIISVVPHLDRIELVFGQDPLPSLEMRRD